MVNIKTPLQKISLIKPVYRKPLQKLGLQTVEDLLHHFPFRYDDFSKITPLSEDFLEQNITTEGKIEKIKINKIWKRKMTILEVIIKDKNENKLKAVWFNQPFLLNSLSEGKAIRLSGKLEKKGRNFLMSNPAFERSARDATNTACLVPVYPETKGITSKWLRWQIKEILAKISQIDDIIPPEIYEKFNLFPLQKTFQEIHFPQSKKHLEVAQKTLAFQEMFLLQTKTFQIRESWQKQSAQPFSENKSLIQKFTASLPFKLTKAQEKAAQEILKDLSKKVPMNRLLNGDVGSGKTIVSAISALPVLNKKNQVAIMAPTEVLALQHFESFCQIFKNYDFKIGLLTNSYKIIQNTNYPILNTSQLKSTNRKNILSEIKNGNIDLIIGTHALIQKDVFFKNLNLVVIDEQHRFGVAQRALLQEKTMQIKDGETKTIPHLLTMTATPIPRSLAISVLGTLDVSILDEMPKNRKKIITQRFCEKQRKKVYQFIQKEIENKRQAFIILPLVEDSLALKNLKSVKSEHAHLCEKVFPQFKLGLLHGKMKSQEKEKVMQDFKNKKYDILVSTSVVEVGIDIKNASIILIEDADRFGLTQLHQFRGRVGRGENQSYCFLFEKKPCPRLKIMEKTNDGFEISHHDLKLRGPGQFFGKEQSGFSKVKLEDLTNMKLVKFSQEEAKKLLKKDPQLQKNPEIKKALESFQELRELRHLE